MTTTATPVAPAGRRALLRRPELLALGAITLAAAVLRFVGLGAQSFWLDEWFTYAYMDRGAHDLASALLHSETHPPLYFVAAWLWTHVFGASEAGLRSLSAVVGTASVPLAYAAARTRFSVRIALVAAVFVAVNPFSVWYSQEARPYALFEALCLVSLICVVRAADGGDRRWLWGWAASAALALFTHFFAGLVIVAEAAWLLRQRRGRAEWSALGAIAFAGLLLVPHLLERKSDAAWVHDSSPLAERALRLPIEFVSGLQTNWDSWPDTKIRALAAAVMAGAAIVLALVARRERYAARPFLLVAATVVLVPLAIALVRPDSDYVLARYLIPALVPLLILAAAGFGGRRAGVAGLVGAAVLAGLFLSMTVSIASRFELQRLDWRGTGHAIGPAERPRVVLVAFGPGSKPLLLYAPHLHLVYIAGSTALGATPQQASIQLTTTEIVYEEPSYIPRPPRGATPAPGFRLVETRTAESGVVVFTYRSRVARRVTAGQLTAAAEKLAGQPLRGIAAPGVYFQRPR